MPGVKEYLVTEARDGRGQTWVIGRRTTGLASASEMFITSLSEIYLHHTLD